MTTKANNGKYTAPDLSNATPGFLIDEIGKLRASKKHLDFLEGIYKQALEARISPEEANGTKFIEGSQFIGDRTYQTQRRISSEKVVEVLKDEPDKLAQCYNEVTFWQLNVKQLVTEV